MPVFDVASSLRLCYPVCKSEWTTKKKAAAELVQHPYRGHMRAVAAAAAYSRMPMHRVHQPRLLTPGLGLHVVPPPHKRWSAHHDGLDAAAVQPKLQAQRTWHVQQGTRCSISTAHVQVPAAAPHRVAVTTMFFRQGKETRCGKMTATSVYFISAAEQTAQEHPNPHNFHWVAVNVNWPCEVAITFTPRSYSRLNSR
eukprot:285765-Chlamydomonas_euryale.AAC.3